MDSRIWRLPKVRTSAPNRFHSASALRWQYDLRSFVICRIARSVLHGTLGTTPSPLARRLLVLLVLRLFFGTGLGKVSADLGKRSTGSVSVPCARPTSTIPLCHAMPTQGIFHASEFCHELPKPPRPTAFLVEESSRILSSQFSQHATDKFPAPTSIPAPGMVASSRPKEMLIN